MKRNLLFLSSAMFLTAMNAQAESFWLILQNSTYGIEKNRNEKHVSMRGTRQAVHKKFGYSSLLVLNSQIKKYQTKYLIGPTG